MPDRHRVLHPGDRNTPVELGTFRELIFEHDLSNEIEFGFVWRLHKPLVVEDPLAQETITGFSDSFFGKHCLRPYPASPMERYLIASSLVRNSSPMVGESLQMY